MKGTKMLENLTGPEASHSLRSFRRFSICSVVGAGVGGAAGAGAAGAGAAGAAAVGGGGSGTFCGCPWLLFESRSVGSRTGET